MPSTTIRINEIYRSIQGESTWAGLPCVFVRTTGCHLRCRYCDTEYAFREGEHLTLDAIQSRIDAAAGDCRLVEITGGEPLLQPSVPELITQLCDRGYTALLETSGACDIAVCDPRCVRILDLKTPGSGEAERNHWPNLNDLRPNDEVKFVLCDRADYEWARDVVAEYDLVKRVKAVLFSAVHEVPRGLEIAGCASLPLRDLAEWILADGQGVRLHTQLHKLVWDPAERGV